MDAESGMLSGMQKRVIHLSIFFLLLRAGVWDGREGVGGGNYLHTAPHCEPRFTRINKSLNSLVQLALSVTEEKRNLIHIPAHNAVEFQPTSCISANQSRFNLQLEFCITVCVVGDFNTVSK